MKAYHTLSLEEILAELETSLSGLSSQEAARRLEQVGPNVIPEKPGPTAWQMFLGQFKDFMILLLLAAAVVSIVLGETVDALAILAIVVLNALIGFLQERRANESLQALKKLAKPTAKVVRDGQLTTVEAAELVPGDLVVLEAGDFIPADGRLVEVAALRVDESALTGESVPVDKTADTLSDPQLQPQDQLNMVFAGTVVVYGRGKMVVTSTGTNTSLGRIASLIVQVEEPTPLQVRLAELSKVLGIAALAICGLIFLVGFSRGGDALQLFMTSVSLAVAAIPEGLPAVVTITLALGVQRMVKRNAIIRKLAAVETLGSVNVICTDKTGTLTQNRMQVAALFVDGLTFSEFSSHERAKHLMELFALCTDAEINSDGSTVGDPTEVALLLSLRRVGGDKKALEQRWPRVAELPFDSERKRMTTVHAYESGYLVITKGALETVLPVCEYIDIEGHPRPLTPDEALRVEEANIAMAKQGLRVLSLAYKFCNQLDEGDFESGLTLLGLVGMIDPPRPEAYEAVQRCGEAGITTVMITGDHKYTAEAIARDLGLLPEGAVTMTGTELERLSDEELVNCVDKVRVYARVSPEHKLRIVKAWQNRDAVVAMTGDGVNDAPALSKADIGVAMGITGTEVAKAASDMVLADDNFATIVNAVEEGRTIYANVRKAIRYLLSCNAAEIFTVFVASILNLGQPLLPIQILWINLVTDSLPALGLSMEPPSPTVMKMKPRPKNESIFAGSMGGQILVEGLFMGVISLTAFLVGIRYSLASAETMTLMTLIYAQLIQSLNARSNEESVFKLSFRSNKFLMLSLMVSALLQPLLLTAPLRVVFKTEPLGLMQWFIVLGLASTVLLFGELEKMMLRLAIRQRQTL
ncbi:calcium-translocating P-type ATPase, PMCA-type [Coprothermobacteraceae bacterium]|nr:calcium-translocating P-type ATPase, PMCA-type [Coprothermobacteraceae bacterium]